MPVVLIVEDEALIRVIAERMIQGWGHPTLSAGDMDVALSIVRSPQHIDVLFTDIHLRTAALGGFELAHEAVKLRPRLRVLYTSGNSLTDETKALFVEGGRFLLKPYGEPQLRDSIESLLTTQ